MFDLPPQVEAIEPNSIHAVEISSAKVVVPYADVYRTVLQVNNQTGYKVFIATSVDNPIQWFGGARPNVNFNGVAIGPSNYLKRNEDLNSAAAFNSFYTMNFKFTATSGDEEFGIRVNQADVFKPDFVDNYYPTFPIGTIDITGYYQVQHTVLGNANIFTITHNQ